eukprot:Lithocolla_globosa_v1_NODE_4329_length_1460_cov_6.483642.p2 type:complete len:115 gc:universal NODE_4329_length_1460_cov_6.483642:780-1124(+)
MVALISTHQELLASFAGYYLAKYNCYNQNKFCFGGSKGKQSERIRKNKARGGHARRKNNVCLGDFFPRRLRKISRRLHFFSFSPRITSLPTQRKHTTFLLFIVDDLFFSRREPF